MYPFTPQRSLPLGRTPERWFPKTIRLALPELESHAHVIGKTGMGKSRFLAHYALSLIRLGYGVTVIDPYGELSQLVLGHLPAAAQPRLTYLDIAAAAREKRYLPFNVLAGALPSRIADNVLDAFHRAWPTLADGAAPRFDKLVLNAVKVLVANALPLPLLFRFLTDGAFREPLVANMSDFDTHLFWSEWYNRLPERLRLDYVDSTLSRVNLLVADETLRYSLGQDAMALDLVRIMDEREILIVNLDKLASRTRQLLGCLLTVLLEQAAFTRNPANRAPHVLILDEFAEFAAQSEQALGTILSRARKFGLFLVMAHQNWTQASERLIGAMGNARLKVAFQLEYADAERSITSFVRLDPRQVSVREEAETVGVGIREQLVTEIQRLQDLPPRHALVRLPSGAVHELVTLDVPSPTVDAAALARSHSERHFRAEAEVLAALARHQRTGVQVRKRVRMV